MEDGDQSLTRRVTVYPGQGVVGVHWATEKPRIRRRRPRPAALRISPAVAPAQPAPRSSRAHCQHAASRRHHAHYDYQVGEVPLVAAQFSDRKGLT